jgi:hypothetical protein
MVFISLGSPEVYRQKDGFIARNVSTGPGGQVSTIVSVNSLVPSSFELSVWLNRFGMVCIGGCAFDTNTITTETSLLSRISIDVEMI